MGKALIIGCGGVASVAIHKCCQNSAAFSEIMIASRTKAISRSLYSLMQTSAREHSTIRLMMYQDQLQVKSHLKMMQK